MRYLAKKLALEYPEMAAINIVGVVDEFGESIFKELNYYNEATNILRFRDIFKDNPRIYIPHVDMNIRPTGCSLWNGSSVCRRTIRFS